MLEYVSVKKIKYTLEFTFTQFVGMHEYKFDEISHKITLLALAKILPGKNTRYVVLNFIPLDLTSAMQFVI